MRVSPLSLEDRRRTRIALENTLRWVEPVSQALAACEPYSPDFGTEFGRALDSALAGHWAAVRAVLPQEPADKVLRHAWAVCSTPTERGALYRAARIAGDPALASLAQQLWAHTQASGRGSELVRAVTGEDASLPDTYGEAHLKPGLRLRYSLAAGLLGGEDAAVLLERAQAVEDTTTYVRRRELLRVVAVAEARAFSLRLSADDLVLLGDEVQELLLTSDKLVEAFVPDEAGRGDALRAWLEAMRLKRLGLEKLTTKLLAAVGARKFSAVNRLLAPFEPDTLACAVGALARPTAAAEVSPPAEPASGTSTVASTATASDPAATPRTRRRRKAASARWVPLSAPAAAKLERLFGPGLVKGHWTLPAPHVAGALATSKLPLGALNPLDLALLRAAWSTTSQLRLVRSGRAAALDSEATCWPGLSLRQLIAVAGKRGDFDRILTRRLGFKADAQEILSALRAEGGSALRKPIAQALRSRDAGARLGLVVLPWVGTRAWTQAGGWALHGNQLGADLGELAKGRIELVDRKAAIPLLARHLSGELPAKESKPERPSKYPKAKLATNVAVELVKRYPDLLAELVRIAPVEWWVAFIAKAPEEEELLAVLAPTVPEEVKPKVHALRLRRVSGPRALLGLLAEGLKKGYPIGTPHQWPALVDVEASAYSAERVACLAIGFRDNLKRLKRRSSAIAADDMREGLGLAAKTLVDATGHADPVLEVAARLGVAHAPVLAALAGQIRCSAAPGQRLDHAYTTWTLPKKSGGTRLISAPSRELREIQRAILATLLTPLGAHEAACGFVKDRSILDNARPHVGSPVVANADVANCFPSVKWPLVRATLLRDLGGEFSDPAIQLLLEICTANGGLPIGAPTSPALLNRVLLRTDAILTQAARARDCVYTRYADDLTFSGGHGAVRMLGVAKGTLERIGLQLDPKKTNIFRRGRRQVCTGLVVNEQVSVPRRVRRRLRAAVHAASKGQATTWHGAPQSEASLKGRLAFLRMIHPEEGERLIKQLSHAPLEEAKAADKPRKRSSPKAARR